MAFCRVTGVASSNILLNRGWGPARVSHGSGYLGGWNNMIYYFAGEIVIIRIASCGQTDMRPTVIIVIVICLFQAVLINCSNLSLLSC